MKLATVQSNDKRRGSLVVVSTDLKKAIPATSVAPNLVVALENWTTARPQLEALSEKVNAGEGDALDLKQCLAPIPNGPGFFDGSAFLSHVYRARKSRGDEMPESAKKTPLMYQGVSDNLLNWCAPLELMDEAYGGDFEGEFAVYTADVPRATAADKIDPYMALFGFFNDITYREVLKREIQTKFGFLQSKPNSAFAPVVVTADEFGKSWENGRIHLDVQVKLNGQTFGKPNGREMHFSFQELVAHACATRPLAAGNIVGTGTVSNEDKEVGFACLTEKRYQEVMDTGTASTPWFKPGDKLWMDVQKDGQSVFGAIDQSVRV